MDDKQILRDRLIAARKAHFAAHGEAAAQGLAAHASALDLPPGSRIAAYMPMGSEIDVRPLMAALVEQGHELCLPVCLEPHAPVIFRPYTPGDALVADAMGIAAPGPQAAPLDEAETVQPDIVLVPLLGYDATGMRLGRGGGYYDRSLNALRHKGSVLACGVAFAMQMVDKCPSAPHDQALDAVLTESGLTRFERDI
jgi:5-formyltetrahydrofolate cyclo-ligase